MLWILAGCSSPPSLPADGHGTVLHVGPDTLIVQHDDLRNRVVPGVERYRLEEPVAVSPGDSVDLWTDGEGLKRLSVTGKDPLVEGFLPGGVPIVGTVVNIDGVRITLDHEAVPGVMGAMVMGFGLAPWEVKNLAPGDRISAHLLQSGYGWQLVDPVITGKGDGRLRSDVEPLAVGEVLPSLPLTLDDGSSASIGAGQGVPTALTFIYTRCPDPNFCPAIAARMAVLQSLIPGARILTVTLDPSNDTPAVLSAWGRTMGADLHTWRLARAEPVVLQELALRAGQHVTVDGGRISHLHRLLILDAKGKLVERYDTADWPMERVVRQLQP